MAASWSSIAPASAEMQPRELLVPKVVPRRCELRRIVERADVKMRLRRHHRAFARQRGATGSTESPVLCRAKACEDITIFDGVNNDVSVTPSLKSSIRRLRGPV